MPPKSFKSTFCNALTIGRAILIESLFNQPGWPGASDWQSCIKHLSQEVVLASLTTFASGQTSWTRTDGSFFFCQASLIDVNLKVFSLPLAAVSRGQIEKCTWMETDTGIKEGLWFALTKASPYFMDTCHEEGMSGSIYKGSLPYMTRTGCWLWNGHHCIVRARYVGIGSFFWLRVTHSFVSLEPSRVVQCQRSRCSCRDQ